MFPDFKAIADKANASFQLLQNLLNAVAAIQTLQKQQAQSLADLHAKIDSNQKLEA